MTRSPAAIAFSSDETLRARSAREQLGLSWQAARREAQLIVDRLQLKNAEINGQKIDLQEAMKDHASTGRFRVMIMQAVTRILEKRGARTNIAKMDVKRRRAPGER